MTDLFICSIKSPQCTDKYSKKQIYSIAICTPRVLMYHKREISLPVGYKFHFQWDQRQETRNDCDVISSIRTSRFAENKFLSHFVYKKIRKCRRNLFSAKLEVLKGRHNHSQSPAFGLAVLYPTRSEISCFWYIKTRGRKIDIECIFCYTYQYIVEILCEAC